MKRTYLVLIITMLLIGFATVATNLVINGKINIGFNKKDFNDGVVFSYAHTDTGTAEIDEETEKTITFTSDKLENINQQSILDYDIANKSEQYDANVELNCQIINEDDKDIIRYENTIKEGFKLEAGQTKSGKITVTLVKPVIEEVTIGFECEITATAQQREDRQEYVPKIHQYQEELLNGANPVLDDNKELIPVTIDDTGTVTYANINKPWHDYSKQEWANAVILTEEGKKKNYKIEQEIDEEDIESYFVWIPKYRYKLWNVGTTDSEQNKPFEIEIEFNLNDTEDNDSNPDYKECKTPLNTEGTQKNNCNNGDWMTHPAFITMGVPGFWVGKFEVGYKGANSKTDAEVDLVDSTKVIIKPDVYSWRNITTENMFYSLKQYATNLDSHMMKNTEWGAVAYLSHSKYGINTEVAQNTNSEFKTGYAKENNGYNSTEGVKASTTGNITGVYDMSGGAWERTAAYRDEENTTGNIGESVFTKQDIIQIGAKYFDVYDQESIKTSYNKRILGDATGEMGPFITISKSYRGSWYQDYADFVDLETPWFSRGGSCGDNSGIAGQFSFGRTNGGTSVYDGSRLVLSPQ